MRTCLFVMQDWPITRIAGGGAAALIYSHLELMAGAVDRLVLVVLRDPAHPLGFDAYRKSQPEVWHRASGFCKEVHILDLPADAGGSLRGGMLLAMLANPAGFSYAKLAGSPGGQSLRAVAESTIPDMIWAEHLLPASVLQRNSNGIPLVYSHHDWHWKIKAHRAGRKHMGARKRIGFWLSRQHEENLVRSAAACASGSATELAQMKQLGARQVGYFPTTYAPVELSSHTTCEGLPRIVHLGGMQVTANRLGLQRFLEVSWPSICSSLSPAVPELWVVGDLDGAPPGLLSALRQPNIVCTGVVADLSRVLRRHDIHIVPWEYDTGTRARIPLVLNHAQILVSTRAAASCLPELEDGVSCVLVENLQDMTKAVLELVQDAGSRARIADEGRETFLRAFTPESQQPRFDAFLQNLARD